MRYSQLGGANLEEVWGIFGDKLIERLKKDKSSKDEIREPDKLTELPKIFIDADPTKNNYIRWIISGYIDAGIAHYEDLYNVKKELEKYDKLKKKKLLKDKEKDINNYCGLTGCNRKGKGVEGLYHLLKRYAHVFEKEKEKEIESEIIHAGAKKIFSGDTITVYEILTAEAACYYGQGTKWCTNTKDPKDPNNRFNAYSKEGPIYIIIPKRPTHTGEKYQIQFETNQFNDELNKNLGIEEFANKYPEVSKIHLIFATMKGSVEDVKDLLEKGANVHTNNDNALRIASKNGNLEIVKLLLDNGADVNAKKLFDSEALINASEKGNLEIVKLLLGKGANIHAENDYALRLASENGYLEIVKLLIEKGARVNAVNDEALINASRRGYTEIVKLLLKNKAYVNARNGYALDIASYNGHLEVVRLLLENGAHIYYYGDPLNNAVQKNYPQIVQLLIDYGANFSKVRECLPNYDKYAKIYNKEYFKRVEKEGNLTDWEDICRYLNQEYRLPQLKSIANKLDIGYDSKVTKKELCELISLDYDSWVKSDNKDKENPRTEIHKKKSIK
jgi:ankyrin repeat protein